MKNKTILFLGDSITEGAVTNDDKNRYVNVVGVLSGANVVNYGVGGTRIARQKGGNIKYNYDFNLRVEIMQDQADYVVVFGGINDYGHGTAPLGNENDQTVFTFFGAVKVLFSKLKTKYSKAKILIVLPLNSTMFGLEEIKQGIKVTLPQYREVLNKVAKENGFNVLNLSNIKELNPLIDESNEKYFYDGLHPNDEGHKLLGKLIYEHLTTL